MTRKIICLISIIITSFSFAQNENSIYYNKNWEKTTKENASFYRNMPLKKLGNLVLIEDFYINKTPQFQGYTLHSDSESYVGDIIWYDENGFDASFYQYYNNSEIPVLTYYYPNGKKRKTIQYRNGKKEGETIVYHQDGTVLLKGNYENGKPVNGDFEEVENGENYRSNESDRQPEAAETDDPVVESSPIMVTEDVPIEEVSAPKKKVYTKIIKKKTFWQNSKQLAQEIWYSVDSYRPRPIKQMNYDTAGKILQTIEEKDFDNYGDEISNGIFYNYYYQNKAAVALRSKTNYKKGSKSGEEIKYYPNGKIFELTKFIDGKIEGDQVVYGKNEAVMNKRTYKNNTPFDGNFDENIAGSLNVNQNYVKGVKEGKAVVKTENDSIVASGNYKNGKPYNGTFIIKTGESQHELINVVDFKKTGVQKVFNYNINDLTKTYTSLNDVLNGETIFYDNGEVTGKLVYKNGLPYDGKLVDSKISTVYKNGVVTEEIFYRSEYDKKQENNVLKSKQYSGGKLTKIIDQSFTVTDHYQKAYEGIYKNEKPFSGYFATDFREFNYVDFYENGIIKYQFSNNYLENLEKYEHPNYDIKSTYKDGKIVDGVEYTKLDRSFISKYWKNGVLQSFDFDVFAMHYFDRFHFELKNNAIEIAELNKKETGRIVREKAANKFISKLIIGEKVLMSSVSIEVSTVIPEESGSIFYSESKNSIQAKILNVELQNDEEYRAESEIFSKIFVSNIDNNKTIEENFNTIAANFSSGKDLESLFGNDEKSDSIAVLRFNEAKKPEIGILILKTKNDLYDLKSYMNSKVLEEKKNVDFKNIKKEAAILNTTLEKKFNESFK